MSSGRPALMAFDFVTSWALVATLLRRFFNAKRPLYFTPCRVMTVLVKLLKESSSALSQMEKLRDSPRRLCDIQVEDSDLLWVRPCRARVWARIERVRIGSRFVWKINQVLPINQPAQSVGLGFDNSLRRAPAYGASQSPTRFISSTNLGSLRKASNSGSTLMGPSIGSFFSSALPNHTNAESISPR